MKDSAIVNMFSSGIEESCGIDLHGTIKEAEE